MGVVLFVGFGTSLLAADPPTKLSPQERKTREAKWQETNTAGFKAYNAAKYAEALKAFEAALEVSRDLYPRNAFPDGHADLAYSLNNLAVLHFSLGNYAAAEPIFKESLELRKRLFKGDHQAVAHGLLNLAELYRSQGKFAAAQTLYQDALEMYKRLFKGDHPHVAVGLNNLAALNESQGKYAVAQTLYEDALEMHKRLFKGDHPHVASSMHNLAFLHYSQGKYAAAEPLFKDALEMRKRLFKGDHPDVATSLMNLAGLHSAQSTAHRGAASSTTRTVPQPQPHCGVGEGLSRQVRRGARHGW